MGGAQESLMVGKPLLCIPMASDQFDVAYRVEDIGAGKQMDHKAPSFEEPQIKALISHILEDYEVFRAQAVRMGKWMKHHKAAQRGADWIESVAQFGQSYLLSSQYQLKGPIDLLLKYFWSMVLWVLLQSVWLCFSRCTGLYKTKTE
jgi:hypothetical protein